MKKGIEKYLDGLDWAIRQLYNEKAITMRQMILILRVWSAVQQKGMRLTDKQLRKVVTKYDAAYAERSRKVHDKFEYPTAQQIIKSMAEFVPRVPLSYVVAAYKARQRK